MEVTSKNFDKVLEDFPQLLEKAQFLAIDTEFTGLQVDGGGTYNYFDTLNEFYAVQRDRARTFLAIQYGICLFEYHPEDDKYTHHAFNFYVYPRSSKRNFSCQVSCLHFLCEHGLDFNKLFREGITYLTQDEMNGKLENWEARRVKLTTESPAIKIPKDQKHVIDGAMDKIREFVQSSESEASLPRYNSFIRRLIYQTAKEKFGSVLLETNSNGTLRMTKGLSEEEKIQRQNCKWEDEKLAIQREFGFSKIIEMIVSSRKLIVGHNILTDLLFTVQQFLHHLPADYGDAREMLHDLFPRLIDTKYLATASHVKDFTESTLSDIVKSFDEDEIPTVESGDPTCGYNGKDSAREHEAGYDAFLTGLCFLAMANRIGKLNMTNIYKILPNSTLLRPFLNKLSIPRMHEIAAMDLEEEHHRPNRKNVFHITFPTEWKQQDILNHFNNLTGYINIRWLDSTSAFIGVTPESAEKLRTISRKKKQATCIVTTYNDFRGYPQKCGVKGEDETSTIEHKRMASEDVGEIVVPNKKTVFEVPEFE